MVLSHRATVERQSRAPPLPARLVVEVRLLLHMWGQTVADRPRVIGESDRGRWGQELGREGGEGREGEGGRIGGRNGRRKGKSECRERVERN